MSRRHFFTVHNEKGFNLIEVIASLVIIAIVLISFSHFFISNNKAAANNNDRLIAINLVEAELERLKLQPFADSTLISKPTSKISSTEKTITRDFVQEGSSKSQYKVVFKFSQTDSEFKKNLINVQVSVTYKESTANTEGYLVYD